MIDPATAPALADTDMSSGLHFLMVDPTFHDHSRAGGTRGFDIAVRLIAAGHRVTVLTTTLGFDNDGTKRVRDFTVGGVLVRARPVPRAPGWSLPRSEEGAFGRWATSEMWSVKDVDALILTAQPWSMAIASAFYAKVRAIPFFLDVRHLPPAPPPANAAFTARIGGAWARLMRRLALKLARRTIVASPAIAQALAELGLADGKRVQLPVGCDVGLMSIPPWRDNALLQTNPELDGRPLVVWAGSFTPARNVGGVVALAAALQDAAPQVCVVLCGDGPTKADVIRAIHARGLPESALCTLDALPRNRMNELLAAATLVLSVPAPNDTASDFFDGLAAGKPVVVLGDGWQRTLLESRSAGFGVSLDDPAAAAREIADFIRNPDGVRRTSQQAAALAASRFNIDRLIGEMRVGLEALIAGTPRAEILRERTLTAKRVFDVVASLAALIVLSPVALILSVLIGAKLGWPIVVSHARTGLKGHTFRLLKFRTLSNAEDSAGGLLPERERMAPLGRFLRRTSLDELPTLLNVLIGDMSLVGPRALPADYAAYYTPAQRRRHELRPGLTGWAQVDDNPDRSWERKFARDIAYIDRVSLGLEAKIIAKTIGIVLRGRDLDRSGQTPLPRFDEMMARREGAEDV